MSKQTPTYAWSLYPFTLNKFDICSRDLLDFFFRVLAIPLKSFWILSGQFITTSAEVTPNGGLVRESPQKWP